MSLSSAFLTVTVLTNDVDQNLTPAQRRSEKETFPTAFVNAIAFLLLNPAKVFQPTQPECLKFFSSLPAGCATYRSFEY